MAKTPNPTIPPAPPKKGATSERSVYLAYVAKHQGLKQWSQEIYQAAKAWNVDPVFFASMIMKESGGDNRGGKPNAYGYYGLGQVGLAAASGYKLLGHTPTTADLGNPTTNLQIAAWYFRQGLDKYGGNYTDAYTKYYNSGYKPGAIGYNGPIFADVPKGYLPTGGSLSPQEKATQAAANAQAKAAQPVLAQAAEGQRLAPYFLAYAGRMPSAKEISQFTGVSGYQVTSYLADPKNNPRLFKSPIWLTHGPQYEALYKGVYGPNAKVNNEALLYGVVHNLDSSSFHQLLVDGKIPGQAPYTTSEEFKGNLADATSVYAQIYGKPDPKATTFLKSAVLGGWNQAQLESYLRSQPEYRSSGEYKTRALSLSAQMGLISSDMAKSIGQTALGPSPQPNLPVATQPAATAPAAPEKKVPVTPGATPAPENAGGVLSG